MGNAERTELGEVMTLTNGSGQPPADWDADEAAERIKVIAHARPEHKAWLAETDKHGKRANFCGRCDA
jgi:hypothetical protein